MGRSRQTMEPLFQSQPVARLSTAEQVAGLIREILLRGEVPPGTKFPEQTLAQTYGVSRNTMREALLVLRTQGLIRHQLHRGAVVAELDDEDIVDVSQARRVLELAGVATAVAAPPDKLEPLQAALEAMASAGPLADFLEADQQFHQAIVGCLGSRRLDQFFAGIQTEQTLVRAWRGDNSSREAIFESHKQVVEAILARDATRARELLATIVDNAEARLQRAGALAPEPEPAT